MAAAASERHDGDGVTTSACRHIQAACGSDLLSEVALLKLDSYNTSDGAKKVYTLWVDASGDLRILSGEPSAAQLAQATGSVTNSAVVGGQS